MNEHARELVMRCGWNATAYQVLNRGIEHWFAAAGDGLVGYVRHKGVRVVAGAPIGPKERLRSIVAEWEEASSAAGERVCYFGAADRLREAVGLQPGASTVLLGAQPVWDPSRWHGTVHAHRSLRAQFQRAANKGVVVSEWSAEKATDHPGLLRCLAEWLETRGLPPLHFLVEPETLHELGDRRIFVAEREGEAVGFVSMAPVPARNGWLTEQFVRGFGAPNGTIERLLDTAIEAVALSGAEYVTMGLVPLADHGPQRRVSHPWWLRLLLPWVRAHGRRFYNFNGLDAFKSKFRPHAWEPLYAISNERVFSPRTLYAITEAFTARPPLVALGIGLVRAARQEARWALRSRRR